MLMPVLPVPGSAPDFDTDQTLVILGNGAVVVAAAVIVVQPLQDFLNGRDHGDGRTHGAAEVHGSTPLR